MSIMRDTVFVPGLEQADALAKIERWLTAETSGKQIFTLSGYAGTGKTTLATKAAKRARGNVVFAAFTGKAALRMQMSGCRGAATIHSLIYTPRNHLNGEAQFILKQGGFLSRAGLIIVDEASMINCQLGNDLLSFGTPVLALGDPAQLQPIKGVGRFPMGDPDVMLTEIHRQAAGSPVLMLANLARMGAPLPEGDHGSSRVVKVEALDDEDLHNVDQIIVGTNCMRHGFNEAVRKMKGFSTDLPVVGDKLICEANDPDAGIFNGAMFRVVETGRTDNSRQTIDLTVTSVDFPDEDPFEVTVPIECFSDGFEGVGRNRDCVQWMTYGYAITAHKAQGSEWRSVLVVDESAVFGEDRRRWLYAAVTRASERVIVAL